MKKVKMLVELIKTSIKAQIITGAVAVGVITVGAVGGYAVYNNLNEDKVVQLSEQAEKNNSCSYEELQEMKDYYDLMKEFSSHLISGDSLDKFNHEIESIHTIIMELKDYSRFVETKTVIEELKSKVIEEHMSVISDSKKTIDEIIFDKYKDEDIAKAKEIVKEAEELVSKNHFKEAVAKYESVHQHLASCEIKEEEKEVADNTVVEEPEYVEPEYEEPVNQAPTNNSVANNGSSNNSNNNSNNGGTTNSTPTPQPTPVPTPQPQPTPEPTPAPVGPYDISQEKLDMWLAEGIDLQSIGIGEPFYDASIDSWNAFYTGDVVPDGLSEILRAKFNGKEGFYKGMGGLVGYVRSTGEALRIYKVMCE